MNHETQSTHAATDAMENRIQEAEQEQQRGPSVRPYEYQPIHAANPGMDLTEYVRYTQKAYEEAYAEAADLPEDDRQYVAQMAWRCTLPIMDSPHAAKAFIACVALGQTRAWLKPEEARALSYTAQLALAALKGGK